MFDAHTHEEIDTETRYDEMLDEVHEDVVIAGITFTASDILKSCDPVAYRCYLSDWESAEIAEGNILEDLPEDDEDDEDEED